MRLPLTLAALALATAAPALAQTAEPQQQGQDQAGAKEDAEKVICRRETGVNSRIPSRKICLTRQQWEARKQEEREQIEENARNSSSSGS